MPLPVSMDATWLDGAVQFNGQELRRADGALYTGDGNSPFGVQGGIVRHNDSSLAVTVNASDVVTIQPGAAVIPGNAGVSNGVYRTALGAVETGNLVARNATNPRIDLVIFRVLDTSVVAGHGAYTGRIEVLAGTPAASPVVPSLPTLAIELARISVPASAGGAATVDSTWRTFAAAIGGKLPVATKARLPTAPNAKWLEAFAVDTGIEYIWNGTAWLADAAAVGAVAGTTSTGTFVYRRGGVAFLNVNATTTAALASGAILFTIPAGYRPPGTTGDAWFVELTVASLGNGEDHRRIHVQSDNGQVQLQGAIATGQIFRGSATWPVGN